MAKVEGKLVLPEGAKDLYGASESALNFPGPEPEVPEADITAEFDTDVLVLGGGHAGLQCALAAAEGDAIVKNTSGNLVRFRAAKGAVLCTGNFDSTGPKAGIWAGGHLDNTPMPPVQIRTSGDGARAFGQTAFLLLNAKGNRFVNESVAYALPAAMENQPGDFITMVTDANWLEQVRLAPCTTAAPTLAALSILSRWWRIWPTSPAPGKRATACAAAPSPSGSSSPCTPPTRWRSWLICWV